MPYVPPTSHHRTRLRVPRATTRQLLDLRGNQWSRYLWRLEEGIQGNSMVSSLFVQIGVLNLQSLTIANVTGERQRNVWLTLAMPHGDWLQINRYRRDLSKSQLPLVQKAPMGTFDLYPQSKNRWWHFLTRG